MIILKIVTATPFTHEVISGKDSILDRLRVELHLRAGNGVNEGGDELEECMDEEGDIRNEGKAKTFWVVVL